MRYTSELVVQLGIGRTPCSAGKQFGSQFPGHPARMTVHDFLPDEQLSSVRNLPDFLGIFVFDKWTCNTNGRQAIFFRELEDRAVLSPGPVLEHGPMTRIRHGSVRRHDDRSRILF